MKHIFQKFIKAFSELSVNQRTWIYNGLAWAFVFFVYYYLNGWGVFSAPYLISILLFTFLTIFDAPYYWSYFHACFIFLYNAICLWLILSANVFSLVLFVAAGFFSYEFFVGFKKHMTRLRIQRLYKRIKQKLENLKAKSAIKDEEDEGPGWLH